MTDNSAYITIINKSSEKLKLSLDSVSHGHWVGDGLPSFILPNTSSGLLHLKDNAGFYGAEAYFDYYEVSSGLVVEFYVLDGYGADNDATINTNTENLLVSMKCLVKDSSGWLEGYCNTSGHPIYVTFKIEDRDSFNPPPFDVYIDTSNYEIITRENNEYTIEGEL